MVQNCPRCQRANPREAIYCYFDGVVLRQGIAVGPSAAQLPREFVFPSGRRCRTFDDLVQGCQYEWEDARNLLHEGEFSRFFAQIGRHDLARAAREHQTQSDPDIALHSFVSHLPASQVQGPRLDLNPRRLMLAGVRPGEQRQIPLNIINQGKGLLQGRITVSEGRQWLKIADTADGAELPLKTGRSQTVHLHVDARGLTAPQTYSGKLRVVTNGGIAEVAVRLDVVSAPFALAPFQGATSPRQIAERMRGNPKQAVPLLESGEILRWFKANGWTYPVAGPPAKGVAAVQQFFECMGLSKPPPLQLSDAELQFICTPPEVVQAKVILRTSAKKWVYAQIDTETPWLRIHTPTISGPQQAQIAFEVDSTLMDVDRSHEGAVRIMANAGQKMAVRVRVDCLRPHEPLTRRMLRPFFVGAAVALFLRLLLMIPADLYARGWGQSWARAPWIYTEGSENSFVKLIVLSAWWVGLVLGPAMIRRRGGSWSDLFCGAVAGAFAGTIVSATLGCLLLVFDAVPATLLAHRTAPGAFSQSPAFWMLLWIMLASVSWAILGGGVGLLLSGLGQRGLHLLSALASPLAWLFHQCGFERAAAFFLLHG